MARLYRVIHDLPSKPWCGLVAMAAVTGLPTSACREAILEVRHRYGDDRRRVTGISKNDLARALTYLGYRFTRGSPNRVNGKRPTLAQWLRLRSSAERGTATIITLRSHYVVVAGKRFIDSLHTDPIFLSGAPYRRSRVETIFLMTK